MSLNLRHLPCPRGEACTAFMCLFSHPNQKSEELPPPAPASDATKRPRQGPDPGSSDHDEPLKRLKVAQENGLSASNKRHRVSPEGRIAGQNKADDGLDGDNIVKRPSSDLAPPDRTEQKRPASGATKSSGRSAKAGTAAAPAAREQPTSSNVSKPKPMNQKAESLNPRLLASSPARHETRLKLLKALHQEFTRLNTELKSNASKEGLELVMSAPELITKALDDEQKIAMEKPSVYANLMKNRVMLYKRMSLSQWKIDRAKDVKAALPEQEKQCEPEKIITGLTTAQEVAMLKFLLTPVNGLSEHGYVSRAPTDEAVEQILAAVKAGRGWEECDRCRQRFQVFPGRRDDGALTTGGACNFHWGKKYIPAKAAGDRSRPLKRFQCCGTEEGESAGCLTHDNHVYKATDAKRLASLLNYVETPPNRSAPTNRAVCFDCEMGYTVHGMELLRLTATSWPTGEELLDVLVQPHGEILDLNSRYSGVWPDDLAFAELWTGTGIPPLAESGPGRKKLKKVSSPAAARELLFSLISPETPLIGHGLENDLNAVRIIHPTVIDTVLLYPHPRGLPLRRGLKALMDEQLGRKIQQETGPKTLGHDSAEDARAAGELVLLRVKHEWQRMRRDGWSIGGHDGDVFEAPRTADAARGCHKSDQDGRLTEEFIENDGAV